MRVVIDTNIIVKAVKEYAPSHIRVIYLVQPKHKLVLDFEGRLQREYRDEVGSEAMYQKWFHELQKNNRIEWHHGRLPNRHQSELRAVGLHEEEDHIVVALALNTDRYVITEDSDFGKGHPERSQYHMEVLHYLTNEIGIRVRSAEEALADPEFNA